MSTILKALRRLEEEEEGKRPTRPESPAQGLDPKALSTDALRDGILAEAAAAEAASPPPPRKIPWATIALAAGGGLALMALGYGLSNRSEAPGQTAVTDLARTSPPSPTEPRMGAPARPVPAERSGVDASGGDRIASRRPPLPESILPRPAPSADAAMAAGASRGGDGSKTPNDQKEVSGLALAEVRPTQAAAQPIVIPPSALPEAAKPPAPPATRSPSRSPGKPPLARPTPAKVEQKVAKASPPAMPVAPKAPSSRTSRTPRPRDRAGIESPAPVAAERAAALPPIRKTEPIPKTSASANRPAPKTNPPVREAARQSYADVRVQQTSWHPKSDRRSAKVRIGSSGETLKVSEGDAVGGMVVREITPSSVLFEAGGVEVRRRVGAGS